MITGAYRRIRQAIPITPLTAPEVQARTAAGTTVLERWKAAARNNAQNADVTAKASTPVATAPTASSTTSSGAGATIYQGEGDPALEAEKKEKDEAVMREHMSCETSLRRCP
jgi:hypothetical protein